MTSFSLSKFKEWVSRHKNFRYGAFSFTIMLMLYRYSLYKKRLKAIRYQSKTGRVVIIGAGFSGICMAIKLKKAGMNSFVILEKASEIGGTWHHNVYPGAACDVESILYCYSFDPMDFEMDYSRQPQIKEYLQKMVRKYDLDCHIKLNCDVSSADYDEKKGQWIFTAQHEGKQIEEVADIFVSGQGQLNIPKFPSIPGQSKFQGTSFHTSRWDKQFSLAGKKVAIIGTGATATQIIPAIASCVEHLTIFQRTPSYIIPAFNTTMKMWRRILYHIPFMKRLHRWFFYLRLEILFWPLFAKKGKTQKMMQPVFLKAMQDEMTKAGLNSDLQTKLSPKYPIGCKRILVNYMNFFETINRSNVSLLDATIKEIDHTGIVYDGGRVDVDVIIYATGFETNKFLFPVEVTGKKGITLNKYWGNVPWAYQGICVPTFPNMFLLYGPNTNLGHNSIIFMIECQVDYIMQCIGAILKSEKTTLEVREDVSKAYQENAETELSNTVWSSNCPSWYKTADGKVVNNLPTNTITYWRKMRKLDIQDYHLITAKM